jgi:signal transduction histidine kinase
VSDAGTQDTAAGRMDPGAGDPKASREFLQVVLENVTTAIFVVDRDNRVRSFNDSFRVLFSKPADQALGQRCGNAIGCIHAVSEGALCGESSRCHLCGLRADTYRAFTEQVPTFKARLVREFATDDGPVLKYLQYTTRPIRFAGDGMVLVLLDDITELEERKLELEALNEQKNRLLGVAAHDLRNPISAVQMYITFLLQEEKDPIPDRHRKVFERILKVSRFMFGMVDDILDISRIEAGKLELNIRPADYAAFVRENADMARMLAAPKGIAIDVRLPDEIGEVAFDPDRLEQVLNNLVGNAVKFSPPGTVVAVEVSRSDGWVTTRVIDQGPGIPAEEQGGLFQPFARTSVRPSAGEKSSGLGLAITRKLVEGHGGAVGVDSAVGRGSTFWFTLPA